MKYWNLLHFKMLFSRVRDCKNVRVFVKKDQLHEIGISGTDLELMPFITNIVYQEVIKVEIDNNGID